MKSSLIVLAAFFTLAGIALAGGIINPNDTFKLSESQKDALVCPSGGSCTEFTSGKVSAKALFFAGDLATLSQLADPTETVTVQIGNWQFSDTIANAKLAKNSATFFLQDPGCPTCKPHGSLKFGLSAKGLAVTLKTATGASASEQFETSVIASQHTNDTVFTDLIPVSVSIQNTGTFTDSFHATVVGVATSKGIEKNGGEFSLHAVKLKSTGITP